MDILNNTIIVFNHYFNNSKSVAHNPAWILEPGKISGMVDGEHAPILDKGEMVSSTDEKGYRVIIIGTGYKNVAIVEGFKKLRNVFYIRAHPDMFSIFKDISAIADADSIELVLRKIEEYSPR